MNSSSKKYANVILMISLSLFALKCNINQQKSLKIADLSIKKTIKMEVPEPSGLALTFDQNYFWTVSDENSTVYKITKSGKIVNFFTINGNDLEGITVISVNKIAVILERTREVVITDTLGDEIYRKAFDLKGNLNEGLEGICYDSDDQDFYLLNEKNPGLLIKADNNLNEVFRKKLNFAKDFSDIFYSKADNSLWILSDESQKIVKTDLDGNPVAEFNIDVEQPEGLVVDYKNKKIYVVSDKNEELYEFNLIQ